MTIRSLTAYKPGRGVGAGGGGGGGLVTSFTYRSHTRAYRGMG